MVGGSSRLLEVRETVKNFFGGKALDFSVNPDEAIAIGAAIYAAKLNGDQSPTLLKLFLSDVTALTQGVELSNGELSSVMKRGTPIPNNATQKFFTSKDN
jgi:heat shock protein 1/8